MIVWVLTFNDGDYYSTYDEFLGCYATKEKAQEAGRALAEAEQKYRNHWHPEDTDEIEEWVLSSDADRYHRGNPEQTQQQYRYSHWYVFPEEI